MFSLWAPIHDEVQKHSFKDFDSPPDVDFVPRPLRLADSPDIEHTYIGGNEHGAPQRHYVIAPVDGETVWFCSVCNDGPYGAWQVNCQGCQHKKCGSCLVETR